MYNKQKIKALLKKIHVLEKAAYAAEHKSRSLLKHIDPEHLLSAHNLLHYLAIRSYDLRKLQNELSGLAISSHSHSEAYSLNNLQKIGFLLSALSGSAMHKQDYAQPDCTASTAILQRNAAALFDKTSFPGQTKIMVTMPSEAAYDFNMVCNLVRQGMHIARINTAHDDKKVWAGMVHNIRKAGEKFGKKLKIYMDIEGPKLRTGSISGGDTTGKDNHIKLYKGSRLKILRVLAEGHDGGQPVISLTLPEVFHNIHDNDTVWFDDGKAGGKILHKNHDHLLVEITHAPEDGFKLKAEKGVNFPDSTLDLPALTHEDINHLDFIAAHADMVGYSFVQTAEDIYALQKQLHKLKRDDMGIILKIETRLAFKNMPSLLFAILRSRNCGIMIARGDLAVEIGYSRMAEVQEEILWLAEAAHLPVIWATQVLETEIKKGMATRAEISDVVKAVRADCVMLNKGPHILEAIATIKDIDHRMAAHEDKKRKILRSLNVAKTFLTSDQSA